MSRFNKIELQAGNLRDGTDLARGSSSHDRSGSLDQSHWLREADQARRAGHFDNALRHYSRSLELDRAAIRGWVGQVQMLVLLGECAEAELWSRKALELFPQEGELFAGRAQALCRTGCARLARELSDGSLAKTGESAYRWMVRGEILLAEGAAAADHCFRQATALDNDWLVGVEIAQICRHYALSSKAVGFVRRALHAAADKPYPWYVLGQCQSDLELTAAARRSFEHCLELSPHHIAAQRLLAELSGRSFSPVRWFRRYWC